MDRPIPEVHQVAEHRVAVVTGASSGLGVAIAAEIAKLGWSVAIGARREDRLGTVAREIEDAGGKVFAHMLDVTRYESIDSFVSAAEAALGPVDVVVNNAGVGNPDPIHETPPERISREIATNLVGPIHMVRRVLPRMIERGCRGDLVFISSDAVKHPRPHQTVYSANKAGLENFQRALSMELEGTGIRAMTVRVGPSMSEFSSSWKPGDHERSHPFWQHFGLQRHPGFLPADQIGRAVVFAVTSPHGVLLDTIEVQPEAPMEAGLDD